VTAPPNRQAGVALITVLLIVFLASIAAVSLAAMQQLAIRRSGALLHQQQARLYTLGLEQAAMLILIRDRQNTKTDHPGEEWANLPLTLPIDGGVLTGRIRDMQGCFNLNNLWQPASGESTAPTPNKKPDGTPAEGDALDEQNPDNLSQVLPTS
jgi:general secretion pathway protein K